MKIKPAYATKGGPNDFANEEGDVVAAACVVRDAEVVETEEENGQGDLPLE